jgi:phosphate transport system substrate-binding protein
MGALSLVMTGSRTAIAAYPTVTGAGSTWVAIALDQWRSDIAHQGFQINYQSNGSSAGRSLFITNGIDFAASEIPFQPDELAQLRGGNRHWQYMPTVAGGTSLMYNLHTPAGRRITSLRLNADAAAKIFTGRISTWTDPEIAALNPGLKIRETRVIPVIRSDGSGTSAQFSLYLADQAPGVWDAFVAAQGCRAPCSLWPPFTGSINANGSDSVANFVANDSLGSGAVGYVEAGYAFGRGFPVASLHNASGNYTQPTSQNVATALAHATLHPDLTQNLTNVYRAPEPTAYPMSSYSYMILPCVAPPSASPTCSMTPPSNFGAAKGFVLGSWIIYIACAGQREAAPLGYSPLPANLVRADMDAVNRLPGHPATPPLDYQHCPNPNLYRPGGGGVGSTGPTPPPSSHRTPSPSPSANPGGSVTGNAGGGDPSVLPADGTQVTVLDTAARARQLDAALLAAARAQAPSRTPLWIAVIALLLAFFTPMLVVTALRGRRRD